MDKKNRVLILVKSIDGGTGTFVLSLQQIKRYFNGSLEIKNLVLEKPKFRKIHEKNFIFFHTHNFFPEKYKLSFKNINSFITEVFWLKKEIENFKPSVIVSVDVHSNLLSLINKLLFFKKIKIIATTHIDLNKTLASKSSKWLYFMMKKAVEVFYNQCDMVVCISKKLSENMKNNFRLKRSPITIYYGIRPNINIFKKPKNNSNIILSIGRLVEQKDFVTLINAFSLLEKQVPNGQLWILGDGPMKEDLQVIVNGLGIKKNVKFLGWKNNQMQYLKKTDIFVLSSKREGFGRVLIEAMACGKPVISTDTPYGPSEILDQGKCGILVPMGDTEKLKDAIFTLLTDKEKYSFFAGKSFSRASYFSEEKMLRSYKTLIDKFLKNE